MDFKTLFQPRKAEEIIRDARILPKGWSIKNDQPENRINAEAIYLHEPTFLNSNHCLDAGKAFRFGVKIEAYGSLGLGEYISMFPKEYTDLFINMDDSAKGKFLIALPRTTLFSHIQHKIYCFLETTIKNKPVANFQFVFYAEFEQIKLPVTYIMSKVKFGL